MVNGGVMFGCSLHTEHAAGRCDGQKLSPGGLKRDISSI